MLILGIESSCDETAVAVVQDGREILSSEVASQVPEHRLYGGVVPEIASRRHVENIGRLTEEALKHANVTLNDIDVIAVTCSPGLIGALLAGLSFAKGLSYAAGKPLVAVNHLKGHICALTLTHRDLIPPFVALVASGGHSHLVHVKSFTEYEVLGRAVDDAAGEAFDKVARVLGLPYPGGPEIARLAKDGDPTLYHLPMPLVHGQYDVSFSGLKTAVINLVHTAEMKGEPIDKASLAASFQHVAVRMLAERLTDAAGELGVPAALCGGVAVNQSLRDLAALMCRERNIPLYLTEPKLCGDNAAMIAAAGYHEYMAGNRAPLSQNAFATSGL